MLLKRTYLWSFLIITLFSACRDESSTSTPLFGKWYFHTLNGSYGELWLDGHVLLTVKSDTKNPYIFDYRQNADTVIIYHFERGGQKDNEIGRFIIEKRNGNRISILQDSIHNDLKLITKDLERIQTSESYRDEVIKDFESRIPSDN